MSITQDNVDDLTDGVKPFYSVKGFVRTAELVSGGKRNIDLTSEMLQARATIEQDYAKRLQDYAHNWNNKISHSREYGTHETAWMSLVTEAEKTAGLHANIRDTLINDPVQTIKRWAKENYTKNITGLKERKDIDTAFEKAQKPWEKRLNKLTKAKTEYHKCCKSLRTTEILARNESGDTSVSEDSKRKTELRVKTLTAQKETLRNKYEDALEELKSYNARYMEDMGDVFKKVQTMESSRHEFFKDILHRTHQILDLSNIATLPDIYSELYSTISAADSQSDLQWWSQAYGPDMEMQWPSFEEFEPQQTLAKKKMNRKMEGGVVLRRINRDETEINNKLPPKQDPPKIHEQPSPVPQRIQQRQNSYEPALNPFAADDGQDLSDDDGDVVDTNGNQFDEEESGGVDLSDDGRPGVPIRALYNYGGDEADELSFEAGTEFEKLEEEDEQGWCKGRLNGKVGLYPANFCVEI